MNVRSNRTTPRSAGRAGRGRGFTLVELMVSLAAGLIVTIAVVGLARTATTSFYEEARLSTTEATVRSAAERLRQDLTRVAFMSTGNIKLARENNPSSVPFGQMIAQNDPAAVTASRYPETTNLQGIRITVGGSRATSEGPNLLATVNSLNPDSIEMTGNFTTDDSYRGRVTSNALDTITLTVADDPAVGRLIAGPSPDIAVRNAFTPGSQVGALPRFVARVVDVAGCAHFVVVSNTVATATSVVFTLAPPTTGVTPLLGQGGGSKCGVNVGTEVAINPVQTVRWSIGPTITALAPDPSVNQVGNKFDLYREIVDATGASVPAPGGPQVVAEYAIDLKFGLSANDPVLPPPTNQLTFDMDSAGASITSWTQAASGTAAGGPAPHRVRSVRFRIATRASLPDRDAPLSIVPGYISRYCTDGTPPCKRFARARTIMSEVALVNQAGMSY